MLRIHTIPAFKDNYFWLIQPDINQTDTYIVDPGDAQPVIQTLESLGLDLKGILLTHHHHDHIDGAVELSQRYSAPIYGPASSKIPQVTNPLYEGDKLQLGSLTATILELPGHTLDHIAYLLQPQNHAPLLFSADVLFACGCGRLFDGTAEMLFASLERIKSLPDTTLIYAAHEYTLANIQFALYVESENVDLLQRKTQSVKMREENIPTLPTLLALEKRTNPFLRCHLPQIHLRAENISDQKFTSAAEVFASLRRAKDNF